MAYEIEFIMKVPGHPCKCEEYDTFEECINRMNELNNLPIRWYDFRIHEIVSRGNPWRFYNDYLVEFYNRRNAKCGS